MLYTFEEHEETLLDRTHLRDLYFDQVDQVCETLRLIDSRLFEMAGPIKIRVEPTSLLVFSKAIGDDRERNILAM